MTFLHLFSVKLPTKFHRKNKKIPPIFEGESNQPNINSSIVYTIVAVTSDIMPKSPDFLDFMLFISFTCRSFQY